MEISFSILHGKMTRTTVPLRPHLAGPTRHSCQPTMKNRGRGLSWCKAAAVGLESNNGRRSGEGEQAGEVAGEAAHHLWAAAGREAHRDGSSMAVHDGRRGSPVAGHRRSGGRQ
jgi:hypothetical protein